MTNRLKLVIGMSSNMLIFWQIFSVHVCKLLMHVNFGINSLGVMTKHILQFEKVACNN